MVDCISVLSYISDMSLKPRIENILIIYNLKIKSESQSFILNISITVNKTKYQPKL